MLFVCFVFVRFLFFFFFFRMRRWNRRRLAVMCELFLVCTAAERHAHVTCLGVSVHAVCFRN